jgi:hypothetical protein
MKVVILGCGPAGLFAAHAAVGQGCDVTIYSKQARKSLMKGAQYLHRPIPGLSRNPFQIDYRLDGDAEGYKKKVYGDTSDVQVSPETLTGVADAWDIREAYDGAWAEYASLIRPHDIESDGVALPYAAFADGLPDLIISTVPARLLCQDPSHTFESQMIWSTDFVKPLGFWEEAPADLNAVICSGHEDDWWYRQARIHGWETTEFPHDRRPSAARVWEVEKPIRTDCTCHPEITRMGRYGMWRKGVLSHEAFYDTESLIELKRDQIKAKRDWDLFGPGVV